MPTYVYEVLDARGEPVAELEIRQSIKDPPLERHPETGSPVRRKIVVSDMPFAHRGYSPPGVGECCPGCVH